MKQKGNILFLTSLVLMLTACAMLWLWADVDVIPVQSESGARDLSRVDFEAGAYDLLGPVEYIPDELLTPTGFEEKHDEIRIGVPEQVALYSTSRLRVYAPDGIYGLMLWSAEYATNVYINGQLAESVGTPGSTVERMTPGVRLLYYTVEAHNGVVEIVQQASRHIYPENGSHSDAIFGKPETVRDIYNKQYIIPTILMGCFAALLLAHLVLFFLYRAYKANLWFSLFCLIGFIRTGYITPWSLLPMITISVPAVYRLVMLTIPAGTLLVCLTLYDSFKDIFRSWFRVAVCAACAIYACVCAFSSTMFIAIAEPYFFAVMFLISVYIFIKLLANLRKYSVGQYTFFIGICIFLASVLADILPLVFSSFAHANIVTQHNMSEYALLVFVFFQMAAMLRSTMQDISHAKDAEQRLLMENALLEQETKVREEMVRNLSHEVRTPLAIISTYAQLAIHQWAQGEPGEQIMEGLGVIDEEARRIADLASHALAAKEPEIRPADVGEIARQLVRLFMPTVQKSERKIEVNITENLFTSCNVGEITQVIWNLLDNAVKHGGGDIEVDGNANDDNVYIIVSDYGEGIAPEILPTVLERGVSGSGGSGLGLALANEIVTKHGGRLIVESEYGFGAKVTMTLSAFRRQ